MTESLRTKLVSLLTTAQVDVRLSEDETKAYPFVTYEMTVNPVRDKDGVCKFTGETHIRIVSDDFDEADTIRATVEGAIEAGMGYGVDFCSRLISTDKDCVNDVWTIELYYTLAQYGDEPEEAGDPADPQEQVPVDPQEQVPVDPGDPNDPDDPDGPADPAEDLPPFPDDPEPGEDEVEEVEE